MPFTPRSLNGRRATLLGVGALVGGGAIVLAGPAFAVAGPSALLAVGLNAVLAVLAALALAELGARFPHSGGPYLFAQRVLGVEPAFAVGWLVGFATLAASAVYALGFARFFLAMAVAGLQAAGLQPPAWLGWHLSEVVVALLAVLAYGLRLLRRPRFPSAVLTFSKVLALAGLGAAGMVALGMRPQAMAGALEPFAPSGALGLIQAMGMLFIAFQGFLIVPNSAGELRDPARDLWRASLAAIALASVLYLPLFLATATVGLPDGGSLLGFARSSGATMVADGASRYLGELGFWWVAGTAVLATLTTLEASLQSAARLTRTMARDRTLPPRLARLSGPGVPRRALLLVTSLVALLVVALPEVRTAGAAAGLIYLTVFALAHALALLVRWRSDPAGLPYRAPGAPATLWLGALGAGLVALINAVTVPAAGVAVLSWLLLGTLVYIAAFRRQASALDAELEGTHPDVLALRGRRPLVLVPIANPENAPALVSVAHALAPPQVGRVTLLNVVGLDEDLPSLENAQAVLSTSLRAAARSGLRPQALTTMAPDPWEEIARVAHTLDCESLLLGLSDLSDAGTLQRLDDLLGGVRSDVVVLRAPPGWRLADSRRVVVPFAGRGDQERPRARLLSSLLRLADPQVEMLHLLPERASEAVQRRAQRELERWVEERLRGRVRCLVEAVPDAVAALARHAASADLLLLGMPKRDDGGQALGAFASAVVAATPVSCAVVLIHARS